MKSDLAEELLKLHYHMVDVAAKLEYYGGFNAEMAKCSQELHGAAHVVKSWGREMVSVD